MRRDGRLLGVVVVLLLLAALALWGASRFTWLTVEWDTPLRGRVPLTASGADTEPVLVPWALLSLAAVAGVLATSGWGRRVVGTLVALAGVWAVLRSVTGFAAPPADAVPAVARTAGRVADVAVHPVGPVVAGLGSLLLLAAGVLTVLRAATLPRLGRRYDAPRSSPDEPDGPDGPEGEPGTATAADHDMWKALDAGRDPTVGPSSGSSPGPDDDDESGTTTRPVGRDGAA